MSLLEHRAGRRYRTRRPAGRGRDRQRRPPHRRDPDPAGRYRRLVGRRPAPAPSSRASGSPTTNSSSPARAFSGGWRMRVALGGGAVLRNPTCCCWTSRPTISTSKARCGWRPTWRDIRTPSSSSATTASLLNRVGRRDPASRRAQADLLPGQLRHLRPHPRRTARRAGRRRPRNRTPRRAHLQSFVDRFKAKATKAKQAQSRVKMLEKMETITPPEEAARARLHLSRSPKNCRRRSSTWKAPASAMTAQPVLQRPEPAHRPGRPHRAAGPQRRGQIDPVQAAVGPAGQDRRPDHPRLQAADRLFRPASGRRAAHRRNPAAAPAARTPRDASSPSCARGWRASA